MERSPLKSPARAGGSSPFGRAPPAAKALLVPLLGLAHLGQEEMRNYNRLGSFYYILWELPGKIRTSEMGYFLCKSLTEEGLHVSMNMMENLPY